jgi:hypothetical protein
MKTKLTTQERFWLRVDVRGPDDCWLWKGAPYANNGYGAFKVSGKRFLAHRLAWEFMRGPIPYNLFICHHCDNPLCVNPAHLFLGTHADNMRDMRTKGRWSPLTGERSGRSKLTQEQVRTIRATYIPRETPSRKLAAQYGVDKATILAIVHRDSWKEIT